MDVIPILSTIILVSTLITLIVAVASYFVFRIKEKKKKNLPPAQKTTNKQESTEKKEKTKKNLAAKSSEDNITAIEPEPEEEEEEFESDSYEDYEEDEYEEEYEEEYAEEEEEEEEEELSAAQSAFMNSMQRVITNNDDPREEGNAPRSRGTKHLRKFSVNKKNKPEQDDFDSSDANSMGK